jgi:enoyl-CoA hydratase/carnithine racemase
MDNPPLNVMGPETVREFQQIIDAIENDEDVRVVVFDSAVDGYFLNHSDFMARLEDLTSMPPGPTGLPPWPDFLVRLPRAPVASIALIRGRGLLFDQMRAVIVDDARPAGGQVLRRPCARRGSRP